MSADRFSKISFLLAATTSRIGEILQNCKSAFSNEAPLQAVTRKSLVTGVRIPAGFCYTSTLQPRTSVRILGKGNGTFPTLHSLREFVEPRLWGVEEFEAFLHLHSQPDASIVDQMRQSDAFYASQFPQSVTRVLQAMPSNTPPMTLLALGIQAMEGESEFLKAKDSSQAGAENMLALSMLDAQKSRPWITRLIAEIYYRCQGLSVPDKVCIWDEKISWVANFVRMLGGGQDAESWLNLYMLTNADNEGGNASAHAARLVSSTEASFFSSAAACCNALSGRRHGDAVADAYSFMLNLYPQLSQMGHDELVSYMKSRKQSESTFRWPGLGHGVFQVPDERFLLQCEFAKRSSVENSQFSNFMIRVAKAGAEAFSRPGKEIFPNVDFASGSIHARYFGNSEAVLKWYTCLFLLSRLIGVRAQTTAERGLGLPIERISTLSLYEMMGMQVRDQDVLDLSGL